MGLADLIVTYSPLPLSAVPKHLTSWQPGITPLSTTPAVLSTMAVYLTTIFSIQYLMRDTQPYVLLTWFRAHNIILSLGSALLLALMLEEIVPILLQHGLRYAICDSAAWTPVRRVARVLVSSLWGPDFGDRDSSFII